MYNLADKRVWVAGHNGMVGAAVCRALASENCEILKVPRGELDLLRQSDVEDWCAQTKPMLLLCVRRALAAFSPMTLMPTSSIKI